MFLKRKGAQEWKNLGVLCTEEHADPVHGTSETSSCPRSGGGGSRAPLRSPGSRSSLVYPKLPAAKPAVFTRIRVVCKSRCRTSCPRDSQLIYPPSPRWKQEERAQGSLPPHPNASPHPTGRNFWDGQMVHPFVLLLPLFGVGVGRAVKTSAAFQSPSPEPPVSAHCVNGGD